VLPALDIGGAVHALGHPSQAASLLGLAAEDAGDPVRLGWDLHRVLEAWLEAAALVPWDALLAPTPSRGRTPRELAVNTFVPVGLLPAALASGRFPWPGDPVTGEPGDDALRAHELGLEAAIGDTAALRAFAEPILRAWGAFLLDEDALRAGAGRAVETPSGTLPYARLLDAQRLHAAQHLRQVTTAFAAAGLPVPAFRPEAHAGLRLPARVY
jgi:hypothetical protein